MLGGNEGHAGFAIGRITNESDRIYRINKMPLSCFTRNWIFHGFRYDVPNKEKSPMPKQRRHFTADEKVAVLRRHLLDKPV